MLNLVGLNAKSCRINKRGGHHGPGGTHGRKISIVSPIKPTQMG